MSGNEIKEMTEAIIGMKGKRLPVQVSLILSHNLRKLESDYQEIEETRIGIAQKYAEHNEDGSPVINEKGEIRIGARKAEAAINEINELMNTEIDADLSRIKMSDIEKCDGERYDSLTFGEIAALESIIDMDA